MAAQPGLHPCGPALGVEPVPHPDAQQELFDKTVEDCGKALDLTQTPLNGDRAGSSRSNP
jgi:hypothetical protein